MAQTRLSQNRAIASGETTMASPEFFSYAELKQAADFVQSQTGHQPSVGLILGSGLGPLAEEIEAAQAISYADIPHFPVSGAPGHAGRLVIGKLAGKTVAAMQGRVHFYEGYSAQHLTLPVRVMQLLGVKTLLVTNAAGGINQNFRKGDLMLIVDHLNMVGLGGYHPLRGPNLAEFGPRFPSMTHAYAPQLIALAHRVAAGLNLTLQEGVYAYVAGPSFESPAEIRLLKAIGADAVGMSTAPEVVVANHGGMQVLGISSISNMTIQEINSGLETTEEETWETIKMVVPKLTPLVKGILAEIN
jgi:purine-nucleoside phosphorylase